MNNTSLLQIPKSPHFTEYPDPNLESVDYYKTEQFQNAISKLTIYDRITHEKW